MKGEYFGSLPGAQTLLGIAAAALIILFTVTFHLAALLLTIAVSFFASLEFDNLPCRWEADEKDFALTVLGLKHRFLYSEVAEVSCEYTDSQNGDAYAVLTIRTVSGKKKRCVENVGRKLEDITNCPEAFDKPQLMQLCDYVNKEMGCGNER